MDFLANNQTLIIIVVITIVILATGSFVSRIKRKKQEEEMNNFGNYSNISKPKTPKSKTVEQTPYKFSLETGEEISKTETNDMFTLLNNSLGDNNVIDIVEKNLKNLSLTEEQKKLILYKVLMHNKEKQSEKKVGLTDKIASIESSHLTKEQKSKMIDLLIGQWHMRSLH